jgi:hypothetical protein
MSEHHKSQSFCWIAAGLLLASLTACPAQRARAEQFVPVDGLVIHGSGVPSDAEALAVHHFVGEVRRFTGLLLPQMWGRLPAGSNALIVGNRATLESHIKLPENAADMPGDARILGQSYAISLRQEPSGTTQVLAAGLGQDNDSASFLGLGYALGELLRRLDQRGGSWGFSLPEDGIVSHPAMPDRTVYLMNSDRWFAPGLSFDYADHVQLELFVDELVDARFSRIAFWQWYAIYLYPGNHDARRAENEKIHQGMRHLLDYARRRGLGIVHMLTPMHANPDLLPDDPRFTATGYYGRTSICWNQPEGRALARDMARHEMEYYGPVDGYVVWFYDPGGCFCDACRANQGQNLVEQFMLVKDLARTISPDAAFQACLWPTWCFHEPQWGINFPEPEVKAFVRHFLDRALAECGPRNLAILDSCDTTFTNYEFNIYSGIVDPKEFKRNGFMHRVLGTPGEASYVFAPFAFSFIQETMGTALERGLDEAMLSVIYTTPSSPSLFAFGDLLYTGVGSAEDRIRRYAATQAKGQAQETAARLLLALEVLSQANSYAGMEGALGQAEAAWASLEPDPLFFGNREWLRGYVRAQRHYLTLAQAGDEASYSAAFEAFKGDVGGIPTYAAYMRDTITRDLVGRFHLPMWRGRAGDASSVGVAATGEDEKWIGVPEVYEEGK